MLYAPINNGYMQQVRLPHPLNTVLLTQPPWSLKRGTTVLGLRSKYNTNGNWAETPTSSFPLPFALSFGATPCST